MSMVPYNNIRFQLYCMTCNQDLEYDPEYSANPIYMVREPAEDRHAEFELDLSWHVCGCDPSEGQEPNFTIQYISQSVGR